MADKDEGKNNKKKASEAYLNRFSLLKKSHDYLSKDNLIKAVEGYLQYLALVSKYHEIQEEKLSPTLFDSEKELGEILLISQVYWGLAKAYDRNERLKSELERCLNQFVKFSIGFKFQYLNYQVIRKYLKRSRLYNPGLFKEAYNQLGADNKTCFIATYMYGDEHPYTNTLRKFKKIISSTNLGMWFIHSYYKISPYITENAKKNRITHFLITTVIKPLLTGFVLLIRVFSK